MLTYWRIFCGNLIGGEIYMTEEDARKAAAARTAMSGKVWKVRMMVGRVATRWF